MRPEELPGEFSQFGAGDDETDRCKWNDETNNLLEAMSSYNA